ncbi:hypothetical protein [Altibacter sp. HG106]|uniref:hypothetical protein n=1 Tax=Altibacter sp. HG106 TaxID=3023937 RepID=UPI00235039F0|nr:hypothetical protein [Altibacter sp. HG106]MDC7994477.1 hypothetical protein [Altibacter sp. HG106]
MIRFYTALLLFCSTVLVNYLDELIPEFRGFTIFGKEYSIIEGYRSVDMMWGLAQKLEFVVFILAGLVLLSAIDNWSAKKLPRRFKYAFYAVGTILLLFNLWLAANVVIDFVIGFDRSMLLLTFIFICVIWVVMLGVIYVIRRIYVNKEEKKLEKFNEKLDLVSIQAVEMSREIEMIEAIADEMKDKDNVASWRVVLKTKARAIYEAAEKVLNTIEK